MNQDEFDKHSMVLADLFLRVIAIENILKQKNVITEHDINSELSKVSQDLVLQFKTKSSSEKNEKEK